MSGIVQFIGSRGLGELRAWCDDGYAFVQALDVRISEWLTIPRSVKTTCIKPSGTVSLLAVRSSEQWTIPLGAHA